MPKTETIRARVEPELKEEVGEVLESLGLTATEAITLFYEQMVIHQGLPFETPASGAHTASKAPADEPNTGGSPTRHTVANGGEQPPEDSTEDKQPVQEPKVIKDPARPAQPWHKGKSQTAKALIALAVVAVTALVFNLVALFTHSHDEVAPHSHDYPVQEMYEQRPIFPPQAFPMQRGWTFQQAPPQAFPMQNGWMQEQPPQPFPMQNGWMQEQPPQPFPMQNGVYGCSTEMWRQALPEFLSLPAFFCLYSD